MLRDLDELDKALSDIERDIEGWEVVTVANLDESIVATSFVIRGLHRLDMKHKGLTTKCSERFAQTHGEALQSYSRRRKAALSSLLEVRREVLRVTFADGVFDFLVVLLEKSETTPEAAAKVLDHMGSRPTVQALTAEGSVPLSHVLPAIELEQEKAALEKLGGLASTVAAVVKAVEFIDATRVVPQQILGPAWVGLFHAFDACGFSLLEEGDGVLNKPGGFLTKATRLGDAFARAASAVFEREASAHEWLTKSLRAKSGKTVSWPASLPDVDAADALSQGDLDVLFAMVSRGPSAPAFKEYADAACFRAVVAVGLKRQAFLAAARAPLKNDMKATLKKLAALEAFLDEAGSCVEAATRLSASRLLDLMEAEKQWGQAQFTTIWAATLEVLIRLGEACATHASAGELSTNDLVEHASSNAELDATKLLSLVNSPAAAQLKSSWSLLVNAKSVADEAVRPFRAAKYEYCGLLEIERNTTGKAAYDGNFELCRNKVCEMNAIRTLVRPRPIGTTRASLAEKSKGTIRDLGGTLSPKITMFLDAALTSQE